MPLELSLPPASAAHLQKSWRLPQHPEGLAWESPLEQGGPWRAHTAAPKTGAPEIRTREGSSTEPRAPRAIPEAHSRFSQLPARVPGVGRARDTCRACPGLLRPRRGVDTNKTLREQGWTGRMDRWTGRWTDTPEQSPEHRVFHRDPHQLHPQGGEISLSFGGSAAAPPPQPRTGSCPTRPRFLVDF